MQNGLSLEQLRALANAGAVQDVWIAGSSAGWGVQVNGKAWLLTQRGQQRLFAQVETAIGVLRDAGIGKARIDWAQWAPKQRGLI